MSISQQQCITMYVRSEVGWTKHPQGWCEYNAMDTVDSYVRCPTGLLKLCVQLCGVCTCTGAVKEVCLLVVPLPPSLLNSTMVPPKEDQAQHCSVEQDLTCAPLPLLPLSH